MFKIFIASCAFVLLLSQTVTVPANNNGAEGSPLPLRTLINDGEIESKYDGFNRETVVTLKKMRVTCGKAKGIESALHGTCVSLKASLHCPGVQLDYVRYAKLQLFFETQDWDKRHPLEERELIVVADGRRFGLGGLQSSSKNAMGENSSTVLQKV